MSVDEILNWVSEAHGVRYVLIDRIEGGFQSGAYLVRGQDGEPAVLKWSQNPSWTKQVLRAAPVVRKVRQRGYPTPAWLAVGATDRGFPYQVQELVEGSPLPVLDEPAAELLLGLVDRQTKLDPDPGRSWSDYARGVVFGEGRARIKASGEAGATVVDAFDRLCKPLGDLVSRTGSSVHSSGAQARTSRRWRRSHDAGHRGSFSALRCTHLDTGAIARTSGSGH